MSSYVNREQNNAYMRAYLRKRYARRKAAAIEQLGGKCVVCGSTENLEFDHIDPSTKLHNATFFDGLSEKRLQAELAKCQLLCGTHHLEKTMRERGQQMARGTHGTLSAYRYCGPPKCEECKRAKREYARAKRGVDKTSTTG